MEKGFYKIDSGVIVFGKSKILNKSYTLLIEEKNSYTYPVFGWYYFDTRAEAETFFTGEGWVAPLEPEH